MHVAHVAIWTPNLERLRAFYEQFFDATAGVKYVNASRRFESYFLQMGGGARLELMHQPSINGATTWVPAGVPAPPAERVGYAHVAFALGSRERVLAMTERLRAAGYPVVGPPRVTGDGYFESVVLDPDGNRIELTV
jgi:lactoylglutathione lyase